MNTTQRSVTKPMTTLLVALVLFFGATSVVSAYKSRVSRITSTGLAGVDEFYDFINGVVGTPLNESGSGTVSQGSMSNRPTLMAMDVSSVGTSTLANTGGNAFIVSEGTVLTVSTDLTLVGTPAGTAYSKFRFGVGSTALATVGTNDAFFLADRSISENWVAVRTDQSAVQTQTVTSIPIGLESGTSTPDFTTLKIINTPDRSIFFIDAVQVASIATDWSLLGHTGAGFFMSSDPSGADMTEMYTDYIWINYQMASQRPTP